MRVTGAAVTGPLSGLSITHGTQQRTVPLRPGFLPSRFEYEASVSYGTARVTITATPAVAGAAAVFLKADNATLADADDLTDGHQVDLVSGLNTVKVGVVENGSTVATYRIVLERHVLQDYVLVTNEHGSQGSIGSSSVNAQAFVTGPNNSRIGSVAVRVKEPDTFVAGVIYVKIAENDSGTPGNVVAELTAPMARNADGLTEFAAPANTDLAATTTYFVLVNHGLSMERMSITGTGSDAETSNDGWTIADNRLWSTSETPTSWNNDPSIRVIRVKGRDPTENQGNTAPVFDDGERATRRVDAGAGAGENIGAPVSATDVDGDTLTYSLEGTDAVSFAIDSTTGQLQTSAALDQDTKHSYSVTVRVDDSNRNKPAIRVTVYVTQETQNNAPVFDEGMSTSRDVAENTATNRDIATAVSAMDADGDDLTYSLEGTDAASFGIDADTGQLKTSAALDYEMKSSYSVTVKVVDASNASDTIAVTINVADRNEQPARPWAPTVTVPAGADDSLMAAWTAPNRNGGPEITGYGRRIKPVAAPDSAWKSGSSSGTSHTYTGLLEDTEYEVQVRALNGETPSAWSPSGTATTGRSQPVVSFSASSYTATEGGAGATVTVRLSRAPDAQTTIPISRSNRSGASNADYSGVPASLTFGTSAHVAVVHRDGDGRRRGRSRRAVGSGVRDAAGRRGGGAAVRCDGGFRRQRSRRCAGDVRRAPGGGARRRERRARDAAAGAGRAGPSGDGAADHGAHRRRDRGGLHRRPVEPDVRGRRG